MIRHQRIITGDQSLIGEVVVEGTYELGMQDQAFLGLEAAMALPGSRWRGVELFAPRSGCTRTEPRSPRLNLSRRRCASRLGSRRGSVPAKTSARSARAYWRCARAVLRVAYSREESFLGTCIAIRPGSDATSRHGARRVQRVEARVVLDGGAYVPTSSAVLINAVTHTRPCVSQRHGRRLRGARQHRHGAMRGFEWCRRALPTRRRWVAAPAGSIRPRSGR